MVESEGAFKPSQDFEVNNKHSLLDISSLDSNKELWLIQWPFEPTDKENKMMPDMNDLEVTLKLNDDGTMASFKTRSGKSLEMVSFACQEPDATVFQSSNSNTRVVGKISRRVSLVDYSEPIEVDISKSKSKSDKGRHGSATSSKHKSQRSGSKQRSSLFGSGVTSLGSAGHSYSGVSASEGRISKKNKH